MKPTVDLPALKITQAEEGIVRLRKIISSRGLMSRSQNIIRIEGYDVSNTQGTNASVAMVTFTHGQSDTDQYRLFNIRELNTPNDYAMMKEAIRRRQEHPEWGIPQLVVIDGGKGQLRAALSVWTWHCPVISLAKNPDRIIIPKFEPGTSDKRPRLPIDYYVLKLPEGEPALKLVQQVRDESHRFSKKQHTRRRDRIK